MPDENQVQLNNLNNQESAIKSEAEEIKEKLAQAEKSRDEYLAGWQRAKADFINYKKEELQRLGEIARYGSEDLIAEFIVILDNFDLGLRALERAGPVERGIYMIRTQIADILKRRGLERLEMNIGDKFDPKTAEAIVEVESNESQGTILEIIESGYKLHNKIIRPTRVKISKGHQ